MLFTILALVTPNIWIIMVVICVFGWVRPTRFVRAEILSLREQPFVESARGSDRLIIIRYLIPNLLTPVLISITISIAGAVSTEESLSFLGFGVPPPQASWGSIISDGKKYIFNAPWLTFIHSGFCDTHRHARLQPHRREPARRYIASWPERRFEKMLRHHMSRKWNRSLV